jgi:hypothetical protein
VAPLEGQNIGRNAPAAAMPRDAELGQMLEKAAMEAQDRIHQHRAELAMWERIQAAAQEGLQALTRQHDQDGDVVEERVFGSGKAY